MADPKVGTGKKPKVLVGGYTPMRILKILLELSLRLLDARKTVAKVKDI